ncbi:YcbK family protein [Aliiroseovarius sp. 2305UL8-7]|uniref:YcbK family protein n=1 Tax=Aliiroseovarius conchicola TaxID=3121637 RepID=UPI003529349C
MTNDNSVASKSLISRRRLLGAFAATVVTSAPIYANAAGFLRGGGDVRRLAMYSGRTGETINMIYWIEGKYIKDALKEINYFMRDWRVDQATKIDTRTIDIMAAAHGLMDAPEPYTMLSGYRSPKTNAMLRSRSRGVAKNSLHMKGQAADLRLKSRSVNQIFRAAVACNGGGVGKYSGSNFVHMDCGVIRTWGR